jgi:hypothetical protein
LKRFIASLACGTSILDEFLFVMIFHLRFIYCEDKGMPGNGIPFVEMLFFSPASDLSW